MIIGAILGIVGGLLPEVVKYANQRSDRQHELALRRLDMESAKQVADQRLAEVEAQRGIEEMRTLAAEMVAMRRADRPSGVRWIDGWNAMIRPGAATVVFVSFAVIELSITMTTVSMVWRGDLPFEAARQFIYGTVFSDVLSGVMTWYFTGRQLSKLRK